MSARILFDVTKASKQAHYSGILRVSNCLKRELKALLGDKLVEVVWSDRKQSFRAPSLGRRFRVAPDDVLISAELFSEYERPGVEGFIRSKICRTFAIFHDAIPLRYPEFTWPHSVQRHPSYMKMLSLFDGVFGVSQRSSILLEGYWEWLGYEYSPSVKSIQLGADGIYDQPMRAAREPEGPFRVLMLGIIEERKGQDVALDACSRLWDSALELELHVVGRANPYFGKAIEQRIKRMAKEGCSIRFHGHQRDDQLRSLIPKMDLLLFASRAEGCGLPVLESLWSGLPVLSSKLAPVRETARFGGCAFFERADSEDLARQLRRLIENPHLVAELRAGIDTDLLPAWSQTAKEVLDTIGFSVGRERTPQREASP